MSFISYAQNYEDVMLWRALKHIENGFYIDVGAAWPDEHSVTKAFYDRGWRGINIEPNPVHHASLVMQRPRDINLHLAIAERAGQLTINLIGASGLSTLDTGIADQYKDGGWGIVQQTVRVDTLASVCSQHLPTGQEVHFLKVDVEGFEEQALRSCNWNEFRPWIVLVEATLPLSQEDSYESWQTILLGADYLFAYADGLNRYYVAKDHANLALVLKYPPNVFDGFLLIDQEKAEAKAQHAQVKARQAEAKAQQAEAKAQQAEAKAQQAEAKAQQAEAKAQQAEVKAQQAQAISDAHMAQLHAIYASKLFRITAPLRWLVHQLRLFRTHGFKKRVKAAAKKVLRKIVLFVAAKPKLRKIATQILNKLNRVEVLKTFINNLFFVDKEPIYRNIFKQDLMTLSPRAKKIYHDLKQAIEKQKGDE